LAAFDPEANFVPILATEIPSLDNGGLAKDVTSVTWKLKFASYKGQNSRNAPYNLKPVGTGPYKIVEFKPGDVVLGEINMQYHVPNRPFFDTVELKGGGDATSAARAVLQTGEFDYGWNLQVEDPRAQAARTRWQRPCPVPTGASVERLQINFTNPWTEVDGERSSLKKPHPFHTDHRIRQAYATAIDRRTIAESCTARKASPQAISWWRHPALPLPIPPGNLT